MSESSLLERMSDAIESDHEGAIPTVFHTAYLTLSELRETAKWLVICAAVLPLAFGIAATNEWYPIRLASGIAMTVFLPVLAIQLFGLWSSTHD